MRASLVASISMALACVPAFAWAQPDAATRADQLFARGKAEMTAGRTSAACAAFAESHALDAAEGTLLALGLCHEQEGKLTAAFAELRDVHATATRSHREDRQRVARTALARIEPRIGRVVIHVSATDGACARSMRIDGAPIAADEVAREIPVAPGQHRLTCARAWSADVTVSAGALAVVVVPAAVVTPPKEQATRPVETSRPPTLGWVMTGTGALALGVGAGFGVDAFSRWSEVEKKCDPNACRDTSALDDRDAAKRSALIANIAVGAGVVLVAVGLYLVLTNGKNDSRVGVSSGGAGVRF